MHPTSFACPHCRTVLRMRDRSFVGREVDCPECRRPLQVLADPQHGLRAQAPDTKAAERAMPATGPAERAAEQATRRESRWRRVWDVVTSPVGVAWSVSAAFTLFLLVLMWTSETSSRFGPRGAGSAPAAESSLKSPSEDRAPGGDATQAGPLTDRQQTEARMEALGRQQLHFHAARSYFTPGSVSREGIAIRDRFSWLAILMHQASPRREAVFFDFPWQDPLNDRFVRRTMPGLLNPAVDVLTDAQGYPATHFVGIAGVGPDAAELDVRHPRAGIFGHDRSTRAGDVRDGTANTLMIAGVQERIGAWAAGGNASVRGLTQRPYVNGPDGFGSGQKDGMTVLMADGSVRFVSAHTDPVILERMAAMADGLPLDPTVPGRPGDVRPKSPQPGAGADLAQRDAPVPADPRPAADAADPPEAADPFAPGADQPAAQDPAPAEPPGRAPAADQRPVPIDPPEQPAGPDVTKLLGVRIAKFEQTVGAPLRLLLIELEELLGAPITYDAQALEMAGIDLQQAVILSKENATIGEILQGVLEPAGLVYRIDGQEVVVVPQASSP